MKNLPMWMRGVFAFPYGLGLLYVSQFLFETKVEFFWFLGIGFTLIGYFALAIAAPLIYFGILPHLISAHTQRKATKALTGQSEQVIRSVMFATGIFLCALGLELKYVADAIKDLDELHEYYKWIYEFSQFLGWSIVGMIELISRSLILFGLGLIAYKVGQWVISKFKRRPTIAMPQTVRTAPRHDAFADMRGYDD